MTTHSRTSPNVSTLRPHARRPPRCSAAQSATRRSQRIVLLAYRRRYGLRPFDAHTVFAMPSDSRHQQRRCRVRSQASCDHHRCHQPNAPLPRGTLPACGFRIRDQPTLPAPRLATTPYTPIAFLRLLCLALGAALVPPRHELNRSILLNPEPFPTRLLALWLESHAHIPILAPAEQRMHPNVHLLHHRMRPKPEGSEIAGRRHSLWTETQDQVES